MIIYIPYYVKWASECYSYLDEAVGNRITSDNKQKYLNHLSKAHEDWQVNQADYAIRLYQFFLSKDRQEGI